LKCLSWCRSKDRARPGYWIYEDVSGG
jgi:hypothetical protein